MSPLLNAYVAGTPAEKPAPAEPWLRGPEQQQDGLSDEPSHPSGSGHPPATVIRFSSGVILSVVRSDRHRQNDGANVPAL
jgi:hypothetical protein